MLDIHNFRYLHEIENNKNIGGNKIMGKIMDIFYGKEKIQVEVNIDVYLFCQKDDERVKRHDKKFDKCLSLEFLDEKYNGKCLPNALKCQSHEADCIKKDVINCLRKNFNTLLTIEKQCLIRYYYQHLTIDEIAKLENISKKTVIMHIKSAKEKLKKLVE